MTEFVQGPSRLQFLREQVLRFYVHSTYVVLLKSTKKRVHRQENSKNEFYLRVVVCFRVCNFQNYPYFSQKSKYVTTKTYEPIGKTLLL